MGAFLRGKARTVGNTATDGRQVWLHGNLIAQRNGSTVTLCDGGGWRTPTTKDRLNGLLALLGADVRIYQKDYCWRIYDARSRTSTDWEGTLRVIDGGRDAGRVAA
jgi:hypothetical protein